MINLILKAHFITAYLCFILKLPCFMIGVTIKVRCTFNIKIMKNGQSLVCFANSTYM